MFLYIKIFFSLLFTKMKKKLSGPMIVYPKVGETWRSNDLNPFARSEVFVIAVQEGYVQYSFSMINNEPQRFPNDPMKHSTAVSTFKICYKKKEEIIES